MSNALIDYFDSLGATVGNGIAGYAQLQRQAEENALARRRADAQLAIQQAEETRAAEAYRRKVAMENATAIDLEAVPLVGRNNEAAVNLLAKKTQTLQAAGIPTSNVGIAGGYRQVEAKRPAPDMQGPMPLVREHTYDLPETTNMLRARFNVKPDLVETSPGATLYDRTTGKAAFTAPYPVNPNTMAGIQSREGIAADNREAQDARFREGLAARFQTLGIQNDAAMQRLVYRIQNPTATGGKAVDPVERAKDIAQLARLMAGKQSELDLDGSEYSIRFNAIHQQLLQQYPIGASAPAAAPAPAGGKPGAPAPAPKPAPAGNPNAPTPKPTPAVFDQLEAEYRGMFGNTVTSTKRTPERNAAVGGSPTSYHLVDMAIDTTPPVDRLQDAVAWGIKNGLRVLNEGDHIHFEPSRTGKGYYEVKKGAKGPYTSYGAGRPQAKPAPKGSPQPGRSPAPAAKGKPQALSAAQLAAKYKLNTPAEGLED
jgi:Peptidase M15